jgi:DNA polymerase-3 subunit delta
VKYAGEKLSDLLNKPKFSVKAALLYGPDQGLVREYAQNLSLKCVANLNDPFSVTEFTGPQLRLNPNILVDAVYSMSLVGGDCVVLIRDAQDSIADTLEYIFSQAIQAWPILIEANALTPRSSLRRMFEQHINLAAIACYPEEGHALEFFIKTFMSQEELVIEPGALSFLCSSLAGNRQIVRRELEKLTLYCLAKPNGLKKVTESDAIDCVGDSSETSLDNLVFAVGDGNQANIDKTLNKAFSEGINPVVVIRAIQRHFQRLHFVHGQMSEGSNLDQALGKLRPPVFFKRKATFQHQVRNWTPDKLNRALMLATENEVDINTTGLPAEILCGRTLIRIAQAARRR